jgi:hypothetical protein
MILPPGKRYLFDLETTGLLPYMRKHLGDDKLSRIHILAIRDLDTHQTYVFRKNKRQDSIARGIKMLNEADLLVGHNILGFDVPVLELLYPDVCDLQCAFRDTMVLSRIFYADEKERDFRRWKRGELEGKEIGRHGLAAWGQRFGEHKGDYAKSKEAELKARFPDLPKEEIKRLVWAEWSQDMEDYCVQDLNVNEMLWTRMMADTRHSEQSILLEHRVHDLMERVKANGFPFHEDDARVMEAELRTVFDEKTKVAEDHFGWWWVASKWKRVGKEYTAEVLDNDGVVVKGDNGKAEKTKKTFNPRPEFGEDHTRAAWGEVFVPKKSAKTKITGGDGQTYVAEKTAGYPFCPVEVKEFNPNSRQQIVDRLITIYGWEPQEFTETGQPAVNDEVLRDLAHTIPICEELAELFYYNKRLGQLVDGKNGWIGKSHEWGDGRIHPTINVGGTVTNRASHSDPNIAQVPRVKTRKIDLLDDDGQPVLNDDGSPRKKKVLLKGREGEHGWDSRNLFYVPDGWKLMGADQKGIELRALGHFMAEFDNGVYGRLCVESDPHDLHTAGARTRQPRYRQDLHLRADLRRPGLQARHRHRPDAGAEAAGGQAGRGRDAPAADDAHSRAGRAGEEDSARGQARDARCAGRPQAVRPRPARRAEHPAPGRRRDHRKTMVCELRGILPRRRAGPRLGRRLRDPGLGPRRTPGRRPRRPARHGNLPPQHHRRRARCRHPAWLHHARRRGRAVRPHVGRDPLTPE